MKNAIVLFLKYINRFGVLKGCTSYLSNYFFKKTESTVTLKENKHPIYLRWESSDIKTFDQVFVYLEYQFKLSINPTFIIDCGANIGLSTLYFNTVYPTASIISIEPEPSNYKMLIKNTGNYSNIIPIQSAVWNKNAILKIEDSNNYGHWGFICKEVENENEQTIKAISIREIMLEFNKTEIDILKIDIEGAELELFSSNYEDWLPKTKVIMIELHDRFRKGSSKSFFSALMNYDFSVFSSGENIVCIRN